VIADADPVADRETAAAAKQSRHQMQIIQPLEPVLDRQARPVVLPHALEMRPQIRPVLPGPVLPGPAANAAETPPLLRQNLVSGRIEMALVLLPGFPLYDLAALCDTFSHANRQAGRKIFAWRLLSPDGRPVSCSLGTMITPEAAVDWQVHPDNIVLLAGDAPASDRLQGWLRHAVARHAHLIASGQSVVALARAGILTGKKCTAHWSVREALLEDLPDLALGDRLYVAHDRRITCAGGKALIDFALACTARALGDKATRNIADLLNHDRLRPGTDSQHPSSTGTRGIHNRFLLRAVEVIEGNLAEPPSTEVLADQVGICPRQLQRLFKRQFGVAPSQFGMQRRMQRARQLLHQTQMSVTEVGIALGFISLSHFSRCYMRAFGRQPRHDRLRLICD